MIFGGFAADAHYKRGICYDETGDHAKAMADYKEAVRIKPDLTKNEDLKKRMGK
jgi:lipoprotein NlpI